MRLCVCLVLALTIGVNASLLRAAEGAAQEEGSISSSDLAAAFSRCAFIDPPTLQDGLTARQSAMAELATVVTSYLQTMQASLSCLTTTEQDLGDRLSKVQRATIDTIYNNGVDQMNFVAKEHNRQVRRFNMSERAGQSLPDDLRGLGRN